MLGNNLSGLEILPPNDSSAQTTTPMFQAAPNEFEFEPIEKLELSKQSVRSKISKIQAPSAPSWKSISQKRQNGIDKVSQYLNGLSIDTDQSRESIKRSSFEEDHSASKKSKKITANHQTILDACEYLFSLANSTRMVLDDSGTSAVIDTQILAISANELRVLMKAINDVTQQSWLSKDIADKILSALRPVYNKMLINMQVESIAQNSTIVHDLYYCMDNLTIAVFYTVRLMKHQESHWKLKTNPSNMRRMKDILI